MGCSAGSSKASRMAWLRLGSGISTSWAWAWGLRRVAAATKMRRRESGKTREMWGFHSSSFIGGMSLLVHYIRFGGRNHNNIKIPEKTGTVQIRDFQFGTNSFSLKKDGTDGFFLIKFFGNAGYSRENEKARISLFLSIRVLFAWVSLNAFGHIP